ncbi:hypothetical protein [Scleromatobacter humisilvae]|uniref:Type-1 restriction enzyme EcoKI specificity protein n=1 Tax=Scleromatobacter humisilvae TaxID=2897159 RepID=A0A9X1YNK9_9BURK|nr:hypothetical protein [Scleromatobacter humisilvae]MCK9689483.1 hypothetical protein [Scleromatobacter humisilvae]
MSLPRYPEYRESSAAWLGSLPAHWENWQARRLFEQRRDGARPGDEQLSATQKYGVIPQRMFMEQEDQKLVLALGGLDNFKHVEPNDFVISLRSFQGGIERSAHAGCVSPAYTVLRPKSGLVAHYWAYLFKCAQYIAALQTTTDGIREGKSISYGQFGALLLPLPPKSEQTAIATFLDRETAKIDALIEEQQRLITLLDEKRQATIVHAVTRGLNPNVPMKGSGVTWMGEVPAHWEVCLLKTRFSSVDYGISDSLSADGSVAVLRMGNIVDGEVRLDDLRFVDEVEPSLLLQSGDLLFNRTNSLALVGKVGLFECVEFPVSFASYLVRIRLRVGNLPKYFAYLLNAPGMLGDVRSRAFEAIGQCNLNPTRYGQILVATPPGVEQRAIAVFLESETRRVDVLRDEVKQTIALLEERRAALIAAAVTGQIDVRDAAHETEAREKIAA